MLASRELRRRTEKRFERFVTEPAKLDHAVLGPEAILVIRIGGDESDVSAVFRGDQQYVRILPNRRMLERPEGNERVVLRVNDQRRYSDAINQVYRARLVVIIIGAGKAVGHRREAIVEVSDRAHKIDLGNVVEFRVKFFRYQNTPAQPAEKILSVNPA